MKGLPQGLGGLGRTALPLASATVILAAMFVSLPSAAASRITLNLTAGGPETPELDLGANGADAKDSTVLKLKGEGDARLYCIGPELFGAAATLIASPTPLKTVHDVKHHIALLRHHGMDLQGVDFDTMLAGFLINPGKTEPSLGDLYHQHIAPLASGEPTGSEPALAESIRTVLAPLLIENGLDPLLHDIEIPVARVLAEMEATGIAVDAAALAAVSSEFGTELVRLERECFELAGHQFNLNSPNQLREILFNELKLSAKGLKKTKSGFSTDVDTLEKLAEVHPLPRKLIEYRGPRQTEIDLFGCIAALDRPDRRAHPYELPASIGRHRSIKLNRSEPAEYPHPERSGAPDSPGLRAATRKCAAVG